MCMGFGCNAAGIIGCRIIDSQRERFIAIITNNFVPCNGRLPILISVISMFFVGKVTGMFSSLLSAVILAGIIVLGVIMTLVVSKILTKTILKGMPSSFTLELPSYRRPQMCLTIHKETQSIKWTLVSVVVPAVVGIVVCFVFTSVVRLLGIG